MNAPPPHLMAPFLGSETIERFVSALRKLAELGTKKRKVRLARLADAPGATERHEAIGTACGHDYGAFIGAMLAAGVDPGEGRREAEEAEALCEAEAAKQPLDDLRAFCEAAAGWLEGGEGRPRSTLDAVYAAFCAFTLAREGGLVTDDAQAFPLLVAVEGALTAAAPRADAAQLHRALYGVWSAWCAGVFALENWDARFTASEGGTPRPPRQVIADLLTDRAAAAWAWQLFSVLWAGVYWAGEPAAAEELAAAPDAAYLRAQAGELLAAGFAAFDFTADERAGAVRALCTLGVAPAALLRQAAALGLAGKWAAKPPPGEAGDAGAGMTFFGQLASGAHHALRGGVAAGPFGRIFIAPVFRDAPPGAAPPVPMPYAIPPGGHVFPAGGVPVAVAFPAPPPVDPRAVNAAKAREEARGFAALCEFCAAGANPALCTSCKIRSASACAERGEALPAEWSCRCRGAHAPGSACAHPPGACPRVRLLTDGVPGYSVCSDCLNRDAACRTRGCKKRPFVDPADGRQGELCSDCAKALKSRGGGGRR